MKKNVLLAFDKFKDALTAHEVCLAASQALQAAKPDWQISTSPLADGGDGFCDTLTQFCEGEFRQTNVTGPLGQATRARYGLVATDKISAAAAEKLDLPSSVGTLAILEFAQSSGIALVPQKDRSPWTTTSFGFGQTIAHAISEGAEAILIGLGGSATNDLAVGALQALGFRLLDKDGEELKRLPTPRNWQAISKIQAPEINASIPIRIACDVENPLLGPMGATQIFGPQKGLEPEDFNSLEAEMKRVATLLCESTQADSALFDEPGAGAAGGAAFGLMLGLGGKIVPGAELVFCWSNLYQKLEKADLVITGEGRFDASSLQGKGPGSLAKQCLDLGKDLIVLAGSLGDLNDDRLKDCSHAITPPGTPLAQALSETKANLQRTIRDLLSD
ncbi:glycerate kinase family protein [Pelagicoccus albus]|uniref:Glycerate kinase n=1 Tax=Pelagicoccus albus TaxID=415222 RepID=A0A7X1E8Y8_9BACT|nr:glycerate kinase [Pelagicoccus albus]MBC2606801.1 glycerate kinase [Pelagicoccus albus]